MTTTMKFTCIGKGHGAPAIPATREEWEKMRGEQWLAEMCRRIVAGDEALKGKLPVWTPCCAEFKDNHRAKADALRPLPRLMLDFDEKGHSEEILTRSLQLQAEGKWKILLVEESVRRGTHVLIALPEGMTPEEAQRRFSTDVGFVADPALKDVSRCIYMVTNEHTLYVSEKLFSCEPRAVSNELVESEEVKGALCDDKQSEAPAMTEPLPLGGGREGVSYPETFEGVPYTQIVEVLEEQMGGRPEHGSRNNFIFSMACHLRYVTNDDPEWIARVLPTYGEGRDKWMATIRSACARNQTKQMPRIMKRTLAICKQIDNGQWTNENGLQTAPEMPKLLPPLIDHLVSCTPDIYKPAVANAVFPALGAHLYQTRFKYIDNCYHEATLACLLMAPTGSGKSSVNTPIDYIMADIRERDQVNMEKERKWKQEVQSKGANKDKRQRPEGIVVQCIDADITSAAFVQRMADAEGRFLYARMNEIEQLYNLSSRGNSHNVFDLLCLCFDYGNLYGQTRIGAASVSEKVTVRFYYNVSTTVRKGQHFFRNVLTDGPLSRINICTIPEREIGSEMPVYGMYDEGFAETLKPYIERLCAARGLIECEEANALIRQLMQENAEFARLSQSRVYENLSFRANVIAFIKAMVLYVAHGEVWTKEMEEFVRWSLKYDLWCKMQFFGEAIEAQEECGVRSTNKGPQNLLDLLPEIFTREEANMMRQRIGIRNGSLSQMLNNWKQRGYIEIYGEEMKRAEVSLQRYIKTEEYLRRHPNN